MNASRLTSGVMHAGDGTTLKFDQQRVAVAAGNNLLKSVAYLFGVCA